MKKIFFKSDSWIRAKLQGFLIFIMAFFFLFVTPAYSAMKMDYSDPSIAENIGVLLNESTGNDIIDPWGSITGYLTTSVYYNEANSIYTYVIAVTNQLEDPSIFQMGNTIGSSDKNPDYSTYYGYDYSQAKDALASIYNSLVPGDGSDIFSISISDNNTINWNLDDSYQDGSLSDYFYWEEGETITFYFQHNAAPEMGFYNLDLSSASGFVPSVSTVPLPGSIVLLGSSIFGLVGLIKFRNGAHLT